MDEWMYQADVVGSLDGLPATLSDAWITVLSRSESCLDAYSLELLAVNCRALEKDLACTNFEPKPTFQLTMKYPNRVLPRLRYRRFHGLDNTGVRESDRTRLVRTTDRKSAQSSLHEIRFERDTFLEFLNDCGYGLIARISSFRHSERMLVEMGIEQGKDEKAGDDFRYIRYLCQDIRKRRFRMNSTSYVIAKKVLLRPRRSPEFQQVRAQRGRSPDSGIYGTRRRP